MEPEKHLAPPRVARRRRTESLHAPLSRYLFGPEPTSVVDTGALLVEIDRLGGVIVPADIIRITGLKRAAAESLLCRLAAQHGGDVVVRGTAVLYCFPRLIRSLPRLISRGAVPAPIWEQRRRPDAVTGNRPAIDLVLMLTNLLLLVASARLGLETVSGVFAPLSALLVFALAMIALSQPLARFVRRSSLAIEVAAENGRRALVRAVLQRPLGAPLGAHALSHAWVSAAGRAVRQSRLLEEVMALGGEPDVDGKARVYFRFPDLDHEGRALAALRR